MVNHTQDFVAVKKYEILQYSLIPNIYSTFFRADFKIPEVSYCDYVWDNLAEHAHLPGLVCGVTGQTVLHGEVGALDMECSPR